MPSNKMDAADSSKEKDLKKHKKAVQQKETSTPPVQDFTSKAPSKKFTEKDFAFLAENEHFRYAPNSKKIAHAVITHEGDKTIALQYELPSVDDNDTPKVRPLVNIEAVEPFRGMNRFRAQTPDGLTPMYAKRFIAGEVGESGDKESIQIACFSPSPNEGKQPFWGSMKETSLFRDDLSKSVKADLEKELAEIKQVIKGGDPLMVHHESVSQRDLMKTRTPDQNTVMGESARDAYEHFFDKMADKLHPHMKERLKRAFKADIKDNFFKNSYRPEWLHLKGWSLMPMDMNPQTKENLGAAPKWANTHMMILERTVKWFAQNAPDSLLTIQPKFEMLLDSELVNHIDFKVKIQIKERFVELSQFIDPFLAYPLFSKASDLAQGAAITYQMLNKINPVSKQVVKGAKAKGNEDVASKKSSSLLINQTPVTKIDAVAASSADNGKRQWDGEEGAPKAKRVAQETEVTGVKFQPVIEKSSVVSRKNKRMDDDSDDEFLEPLAKKRKFPTQHQHERSVVQIYSDFFIADYDNPWRGPESASCSGSGFIVEDSEGKKYVMTNAHVAENTTFLQIRLANNRIKKYEARVKCVSYQCDLALLEVDDPEFNDQVEPIELGEMVGLRDRIMVVGFPIGGTEISLSKGIVSRIQVDSYSMSDQRLLQAQVDAAINPGNSGGPVFIDNKVVGVAFQGYDGHQGLNYIIPVPIMKHFLNEAFSGKKYRGFPIIPMTTEEIENPIERNFYKMGEKSGIRVIKVDTLSDAFSKLQPDDIILAIDGYLLSNEGTVDIPDIGNCIDFYHITQSKFIGDSVKLNILRKKLDTDLVEELEVDVLLDTILGDTEKVSVPEHDKMPTYYINSGVCFVPLTRNYMQGDGCKFDEMILVEENCTLADAPKKNPNEQIVIISSILNCKETHGYDKHLRGIVKEINGKPITNIHDTVRAMEDNKEKRHVISLASKSKIVIPNMSAQEHAKLLKRNHITQDRSADLETLEEIKDSLQMIAPKKSEQFVEEMELTQSGMHALFVQMGYPAMISGSIYDGKPTLNLDALNRQGFMPILADVGQNKVSGHWIMLIPGRNNEYFIFDPVGAASGITYVHSLASQLPKGATLSVIPNVYGYNRGLCGYWVASIGLKIHEQLNQASLPNLALLGRTISDKMLSELANNGFMKIITWLQSIAEKFTGVPSEKPIDAKELREASASWPQRRVEVTHIKPLSSGRRIIQSDEEDDSELEETFQKAESYHPKLQRHGFFQPSSRVMELDMEKVKQFKFK